MNVTETKALQKVKEILTDAGIEATTMRNSNLKIGTVNIEFQEWEGDRGLMENWFCGYLHRSRRKREHENGKIR